MPYFQYDPIQINRFAQLHMTELCDSRFIFCKTDFIPQEFENIEGLDKDVVLISGNSDYCITDDIVKRAPKNIKKWFCQNRLSSHPLLESIPLGIENHQHCVREGHGIGYDHAVQKYRLSRDPPITTPTKFIYANFKTWTNTVHRQVVKQAAISIPFITWQDPNLTYSQFIHDILDHEAVLCPQGNDRGDNHRIYEVLYMGRVPITFNKPQYEFLHKKFPTVLIEENSQLYDEDWLREQIQMAKKSLNHNLLDFSYWKNLSMESVK